MQINSGLHAIAGTSVDVNTQVLIILLITAVATTSTITGIGKGIQYLSKINVALMFILLLFVFIAGPTLYQLKLWVTTVGGYIGHFVDMSLWMDMRPGKDWQKNWTLFYWGWWISWSPFVGIFIARISKGRTVREFIGHVLIIPTLVTFFWLSVFGGSAFFFETQQNAGLLAVVNDNVAMSLNALLKELPFAAITQWIGLLLVIIFFITSSDSGSYVDDMVTSGGHPNPPAIQRAFWGISEGAVAAVLIMAGGLSALRTASISAGLPQSFLVLACCVSIYKAFKEEKGLKPFVFWHKKR